MPRPQDIQDLIDHAPVTEGVHGITSVPAPGAVPMSGIDNKIDDGWLSENVSMKGDDGKVPVTQLPDDVVLLEDGKIPDSLLPIHLVGHTYQSIGDMNSSGFTLADGTDLITIVQEATSDALKSVENTSSVGTNCGFLSDAGISIPTPGRLRLHRYYNCNCNCNCST